MEVINIDDSDDDDEIGPSSLSTSTPAGAEVAEVNNQEDHDDYEYKVMLLMDHREFGLRKNDAKVHQNYLKELERLINKAFNETVCEIVALKSADYQFVVRKISKATGQVVDTRLLELIIERKDVGDLASCLINKSKTHAPLSSFQAQMYKLINCGIKRKLFLMEGNEDNFKWLTKDGKPASIEEKRLRRLRIKTTRLLVEAGRFQGVELVSTRSPCKTRKFLIHQMKLFMESFDPRDFSSMKTMEQFKDHVNKQMKDPTFLKYIALRRQPRIGDVTAMKIIKDPNEPWDKSFVSPCLKHDDIRADIKDEATYWDSRTSARQQESAENTNAGAPPQQQPAAASSSRSERSASSSSHAPAAATAANESNVSTANRSNSSSSAAATSNGGSNPYSSSAGGATASFPYSTNSARAKQKPTGEKSQTKKRSSAPKQTPYKKRQKPSEKVYVRQNPSHSKSSSSTPKESFTHNGNRYMTANPLHESRNSSLVAALLNDDESMNTKPKAKDVSVRREASANLSGAKSAGAEKFNYMLEFDEDDIEGQVVAVPVTQNTKSDLEDEAPTRDDDDQKEDADSKYASKSSSWYDEYKDVLESSSDDDSVSSAEMGNKQGGAKATNKNDVIVIDDDDDDDGSVGSVIILD